MCGAQLKYEALGKMECIAHDYQSKLKHGLPGLNPVILIENEKAD